MISTNGEPGSGLLGNVKVSETISPGIPFWLSSTLFDTIEAFVIDGITSTFTSANASPIATALTLSASLGSESVSVS